MFVKRSMTAMGSLGQLNKFFIKLDVIFCKSSSETK